MASGTCKLYLGGVWDCYALCFSAPLHVFYALSSRKKSGVVRAPKEVLHELQFFVELLYSGVCGAVPNTLLPYENSGIDDLLF